MAGRVLRRGEQRLGHGQAMNYSGGNFQCVAPNRRHCENFGWDGRGCSGRRNGRPAGSRRRMSEGTHGQLP